MNVLNLHTVILSLLFRQSLRKVSWVVALFCSASMLHAQLTTGFPATAVGKASIAQDVTISISASGTLATVKAVTQSAANSEFTVAAQGTCSAGATLTSGTSCTLSVVFQPRFPGLRRGAVNLLAANGALLGQANLIGSGKGPLGVLTPGRMDTVAGDGDWLFQRDYVVATNAPIFLPTGIVEDAAGNLFLSDSSNNRIRRVDAQTGFITTIAGNGSPGFSGDNGPATSAMISAPAGLVLDGASNLYFVDSGNHAVRRVDAVSGVITTVAGMGGVQGFAGDTGAATAAKLSLPEGIAMDAMGNLFIADTGNNAIRKVSASTGVITTIAGGPNATQNLTGVPAADAMLNTPWGVAIGTDGLLYIADLNSNRVLKITSAGILAVVAGNSGRSFTGDGGDAASASLNAPAALVFDPAGNLYIADSGNNRIREVTAADGIINTISGADSEQFTGDGLASNLATFYGPYSLFFDQTGNLLIADMFHNRIRRISATALPLQFATIRVSKTSPPQAEAVANDGNADLHLAPFAFVNASLDPATTTCAISPDATQNPILAGNRCNLGVQFAPVSVGNPIIGTVTVNTDAANSPNVVTLSGQVLTVNPTTVTVAADTNPSLLGTAVTFTASVSSSDTALSGTVDFLDGTAVLCHGVTLQSNSASCKISTLALGQHSITANYSGDSDNAAGVSLPLVQIVKQPATVVLTATPNPAIITNAVVLGVAVTASTGVPTGTVTFYDGTTAIGGATLVAGVGAFTTTSLSSGTHALTAKYAGDATDAAGTSNSVSEVIHLGPTATLLASSNTNVVVGAAVSFTATVSSTAGLAVGGTVKFTDGGATLGSATMVDGVATFTTSGLAPGAHSIVATYAGDTLNATSASPALTQTIQQIGTVTALTADSNPINAGGPAQLTARVALTAGATAVGTLSGTITFTDGSTTLGTASIDANGSATLLVRNLSVGTHTLLAAFGGSTNYSKSTSAGLAEVVKATATTTGLSANGIGAISGKPVTLTAVVSSTTGTPTGSITFLDGAVNLGQSTLNGQAQATLTLTSLSVGSHSITAVYGGDSNYTTSTSSPLAQVITIGTVTLTLSGPGGPVNVGTAANFNVSLTTDGVTPTGTLALMDGTNVIGTQTLTAAGTYAFSTSALALGAHAISVTYVGDSNHGAAATTPFALVIQQAATTSSLQSSTNPVTLGQALTLTASVTSAGPNVTGSMSFFDGATLLGSAGLGANGSATLTTSSLTAGTHNLTAVYSGDTNHATSTTASLAERVVQPVQLGLTSTVNPAIAGASLTFNIKLAGSGSLIPSGTVKLLDGQSLLATLTADPTGLASFTTKSLAVGSHTLTATYAGDNNFANGVSNALVETIINADTQITLSSSANPATFGSPVSLTAVVKTNGGTASGNITFTDGSSSIGAAVLDATGTATLTISSLTPGAHSIVANYTGDSNSSASVSTPLTLVVKQTTSVALASSLNPSPTVSSITFTATMTNAGQGSSTGTVTFSDGATQLGTVNVDATGSAALTVQQLSAGTHNIVAAYSGDGANFPSTSAALAQVVQLRPTTTALTATPDPSNSQQLILIGVVRWTGSSAVPTGVVTFTNGGNTVGSVAVDSTGVATLTINVGNSTQTITATYAGDANYSGSASAATTVGSGTATQFTMGLSPNTMSFQSKQHSVTTLTIASLKGYADTMSFGCLGLPQAATCTFSSTQSALAANGTISVQLTVDTGNPLGAGGVASNERSSSGLMLCFLPGIALAGIGLWKSRKRSRLMALLLLLGCLGATASLTGCGGITINGTPPGTYKFQVTARGQNTGVAQSQTMTLTVTQ